MVELRRDPQALAAQEFDILVIGGGINGSAIAWDSALRGFRTALVEKADFGGATSAGCYKTVHGGLRFLQHLDVLRLEESAAEQRTLRLIAPHLVHPLAFLIPCYGLGMKSRGVLKVALSVYELLAWNRNKGVGEAHRLPTHKLISREQCLQIAPGVSQTGLSGGMVYYDCQMSNCERLTFSVAQAAAMAGATVVNYAEAVKIETNRRPDGSEAIERVTVRDKFDGREYQVKVKLVVNAAGPWANSVQNLLAESCPGKVKLPTIFSKGIQLVLPQFIAGSGVAIESRYRERAALVTRGGRSYFTFPWRGKTLVGTSDTVYRSDPDKDSISRDDICAFLDDLRAAYKTDLFAPEHVQFAFGGLRPINAADEARLARDEHDTRKETKILLRDIVIDHEKHSGSNSGRLVNFISSVEVKYTTFRALAEHVVDLVSKKLKGRVVPCRTNTTPLPGGEISDYHSFVSAELAHESVLSRDVRSHLITNYGSVLSAVSKIAGQSPELALPVAQGNEVIAAELVHAARHEMVCKLSDVVLRRTGLGTVGHPGEKALHHAAELVGRELGWDKARKEQEAAETDTLLKFS
jgi:glycerol-3-phosphate dehydrogenase